MMVESVYIMKGESVGDAMERAERRMKERLWREVWRDLVELDGVEYAVEEKEGGILITARYEDKI